MKEAKRRSTIQRMGQRGKVESLGRLQRGVRQPLGWTEQQDFLLVSCGSCFMVFALAVLLHFLFQVAFAVTVHLRFIAIDTKNLGYIVFVQFISGNYT
jgi:hypothetical protein